MHESVTTKNPQAFQQSSEAVLVLSVLTATEQKELKDCEAVIAIGWHTFVKVGQALALIRDKRLYRAQYGTFEAYCRQKWQYSKSHVYRLIGAAELLTSLSPKGDIPSPVSEAQVRPLLGLSAEQAMTAWGLAVNKANGSTVTAKMVKVAVAKVTGKPLNKPSKSRMSKNFGPRWAELHRLLTQAENALRSGESAQTVLHVLEKLEEEVLKLQGQESRSARMSLGAATFPVRPEIIG